MFRGTSKRELRDQIYLLRGERDQAEKLKQKLAEKVESRTVERDEALEQLAKEQRRVHCMLHDLDEARAERDEAKGLAERATAVAERMVPLLEFAPPVVRAARDLGMAVAKAGGDTYGG